MSAKGKPKTKKSPPPNVDKPAARQVTVINLGRPFTIIALVLLLLVIGVVWAGPGINIDLLISLAGGRDIAAGHLGQPDNWSFITEGRVWLNQNWGSDLLFYLCQHSLGANALLWLKGILIAACALFPLLAARRRKVLWPFALLSTALIIIICRNYLYLRPNIMTLVLAPLELWLLYRSWERPAQIWLVPGVILLWANVHGGFIFGLGMMALWAACLLITAISVNGTIGLKRHWQLVTATVVAVLLAGFVNPFGPVNLAHPFLMLTEKYWRNVAEWQPIFSVNFNLATTWEFFVIIGGITIIVLRRLMTRPRRTRPALAGGEPQPEPAEKPENVHLPNTGVIVFELILFWVLVYMAFESQRFIPLTLILLIPVLAMQIEWWASRIRLEPRNRAPRKNRSHWKYRPVWTHRPFRTVVILALLVLLLTYGQTDRLLHYYSPKNPQSTPEPFFEKMNLAYHFFPASLARFVNDNRIEGNVFGNWEWEGYLRFNCPQLKVFAGGRAQQVYRVSEYQLYNNILTGQSPADELKRLKIHMVACSYSGVFTDFINRLMVGGQWVVIFNDNYNCLLVDTAWEQAQSLMNRVSRGRLTFQNRADGLLSQATYFLSPAVNEERSKAIELIKQLESLRPSSKGYLALANFIFTESPQTQEVVAFLLTENRRLGEMSSNIPDGQEILMSRYWISMILIQYYTNTKQTEEAQLKQEELQEIRQDITAMHERWDYQK